MQSGNLGKMIISSINLKKNDQTQEFSLENFSVEYMFASQIFLSLKHPLETKDFDEFFFLLEDSSANPPYFISVFKELNSQQVNVSVDGTSLEPELLFQAISEKSGIEINQKNWETRFISVPSNADLRYIKEQMVNSNKQILKDTNADIDLEREEKMIQLKSQIDVLEKEIAIYKDSKKMKEEAQNKIAKHEEELKDISTKLEDSEYLIQIMNRINRELAKFGNQQPPDEIITQKVEQLKQTRIKKVIEILKTVKNFGNIFVSHDQTYSKEDQVNISMFVAMIIVQTLLTTIIYIATSDVRIIFVGFIALLIIFLGIIYAKLSIGKALSQEQTNPYKDKNLTFDRLMQKFDRQENAFFVNAAWITALRKEKQTVEQVLQNRLEGQRYNDVVLKISKIKREIAELKSNLEEIDKFKISAEEYLKKRRELDTLKVELEITEDEQSEGFEDYVSKVNLPFFVLSNNTNASDWLEEMMIKFSNKVQIIKFFDTSK